MNTKEGDQRGHLISDGLPWRPWSRLPGWDGFSCATVPQKQVLWEPISGNRALLQLELGSGNGCRQTHPMPLCLHSGGCRVLILPPYPLPHRTLPISPGPSYGEGETSISPAVTAIGNPWGSAHLGLPMPSPASLWPASPTTQGPGNWVWSPVCLNLWPATETHRPLLKTHI